MSQLAQKVSFTVPVTSGNYAPEVIDFSSQNASITSEELASVLILVAATVAAAVLELWLLDVGTDATNAGNYHLFGPLTSGTVVNIPNWRGAQIRAKSGGTSGSLVASASAALPVRSHRA